MKKANYAIFACLVFLTLNGCATVKNACLSPVGWFVNKVDPKPDVTKPMQEKNWPHVQTDGEPAYGMTREVFERRRKREIRREMEERCSQEEEECLNAHKNDKKGKNLCRAQANACFDRLEAYDHRRSRRR